MALCRALGKVVRESLRHDQTEYKAFGKVDDLLPMIMIDQFKAMVILAVAAVAAPAQADSSSRFDSAFGVASTVAPKSQRLRRGLQLQ